MVRLALLVEKRGRGGVESVEEGDCGEQEYENIYKHKGRVRS